ncbi:16512_t:CDS:1, partial [Rhizophagus irregularis]
SDARCLSSEAIEEIRNAQNNIPDARRIMCKKHRIGSTTYQKIIDNKRPPEPTEEWRRIIESVSISDQISENNQESLHDTSSSTIIQEDGITHTEYPMDNENDANSNGLNTVTNERKDKVSRKKKASIKPKDESSSADKVANSFKDDTSRREFDLNKLVNITREAVMHPIYSP